MDHVVTVRNVHKAFEDIHTESIHLEIEKGNDIKAYRKQWGWKKFEYDDEFNKAG